MTDYAWTDERVEQLKQLWAAKKTASQIACEMDCPSRSAIIGKVHRLRLTGRPRGDGGARPRSETSVPHMRRATPRRGDSGGGSALSIRKRQAHLDDNSFFATDGIRDLPPEELLNGGVSFFDLRESHCRYPVGDGQQLDTLRFCGEDKLEHCSYCARHFKVTSKPSGPPPQISKAELMRRVIVTRRNFGTVATH